MKVLGTFKIIYVGIIFSLTSFPSASLAAFADVFLTFSAAATPFARRGHFLSGRPGCWPAVVGRVGRGDMKVDIGSLDERVMKVVVIM